MSSYQNELPSSLCVNRKSLDCKKYNIETQMCFLNDNGKEFIYPGYQYHKNSDKNLIHQGSNTSSQNYPIVKDSLERLNYDIEKFNNSHKIVNLHKIERLNKLARSGSELKNSKELLKQVDKQEAIRSLQLNWF